MLPLIITATISFMVMRIFEKYSIYSKRIAQNGDLLTHDNDQAVLTLLKVSDVMKDKYPRVHPEDTLRTMSALFKQSSAALFAVVDNDGKLEGIVNVEKIHSMFSQTAKYDKIHVYNLMDTHVTTISSNEKMDSVMRKFESTGAWRLPVVDAQGHYLGCVSNTRILMAYRDQIRALAPED